jgi:hypothetical protein
MTKEKTSTFLQVGVYPRHVGRKARPTIFIRVNPRDPREKSGFIRGSITWFGSKPATQSNGGEQICYTVLVGIIARYVF